MPISCKKMGGPNTQRKNFVKTFMAEKFESVRLDTFTIPIPLPAGGSHWVFDSQTTPFPWDDPLSSTCPMTILLKRIVGRLPGDLTEKRLVGLPTFQLLCVSKLFPYIA
jgi:hypothetical protein